jgi:dTDP-4-amino-4,6-dideoxygalactose transaminase
MQPIFKEYPAYGGSNSEYLFKYGLCLPSGSNLSEEDLGRIADKIKQAFEN